MRIPRTPQIIPNRGARGERLLEKLTIDAKLSCALKIRCGRAGRGDGTELLEQYFLTRSSLMIGIS